MGYRVISPQERVKRAMNARAYRARLQAGRRLAHARANTVDRIMRRARRSAIKDLKNRVAAGILGKGKPSLLRRYTADTALALRYGKSLNQIAAKLARKNFINKTARDRFK